MLLCCAVLGVTVANDLSWRTNITSAVGKAQQRLFYLRKLKRAKHPQGLMVNFYHCAVDCTRAEQEALHRVVKAAGRIIGKSLPEISTVFTSRCLHRVNNILQDQFHPAHHLFQRLPSGRRYRSIPSRTSRLTNSFYPQAIRLLNEQPAPHPTPNPSVT
ncbi:hypothetical protein N1851_027436 [Merluccius polli]|uniref:Alkylated DNA repair protein AlkB homologue 8 N-terminal domain-containing protein n=1 Tax=Merluccius polli TaxID=89951 RepID=A0AA47MA27_MERPO|nr:hypothetical protein N1851_027436 [Merluccius polli]